MNAKWNQSSAHWLAAPAELKVAFPLMQVMDYLYG